MPRPFTKPFVKKTKKSPDEWQSRSFIIKNATGLHARAAAALVKIAKLFPAEAQVCKDRFCVNGKSILGVLMLGAEKGETIEIKTKGIKAKEALDQLGQLIEDGFGEK